MRGGIMFWTVKQAARYLGLERHQIYYLLVMGTIEGIKVTSRVWRIVPTSVMDYKEKLAA